jgi:hypothetical protein
MKFTGKIFERKIYKSIDLEAGAYEGVTFNFENEEDKDYITIIFTLPNSRELRVNYFAEGGRSITRLASEIVQNYEEFEEKTVPEILTGAVGKTFTLYVGKYLNPDNGRIYTNYNLVPRIDETEILNDLDKEPLPM